MCILYRGMVSYLEESCASDGESEPFNNRKSDTRPPLPRSNTAAAFILILVSLSVNYSNFGGPGQNSNYCNGNFEMCYVNRWQTEVVINKR